MASKWPSLNDVEKLSPRVIRILGQNPGKFTLQGSNTYLVGTGSSRILVDTGQGIDSWFKLLQSVLEAEKCTISTVLITHRHGDHIGGIKHVQTLQPVPEVHKNEPDPGWSDISNNQTFQVEGATLRAFHSPGHTTDHMAFFLQEEDALFTGDNVLGHGTAVFEDLPVYLDSLNRMAAAFNGRAYPGHGEVLVDGPARIREYVAHRAQREKELVEVLMSQPDGSAIDTMGLVRIIYKDTPETLHFAAARGVMQILEKLSTEGKVTYNVDDSTWTMASKASL